MKQAARTPANIRVSPRAYELLRRLALEEEVTMQAILDLALERYRRERFLRAANEDFAALKRHPRAWKQHLRERQLWDRTLTDGLEKE